MKNSSKVSKEKVYINNSIHVLFYYKENCHIIGICEEKKMNIMEKAPLKKRILMIKYAYEECLINKPFKSTNKIKGNISLQSIKLGKNEKVLILKGRTIVAVYQYGVDFIEGLSIEAKKEVIVELYQFGYINADTWARMFNKLEIR